MRDCTGQSCSACWARRTWRRASASRSVYLGSRCASMVRRTSRRARGCTRARCRAARKSCLLCRRHRHSPRCKRSSWTAPTRRRARSPSRFFLGGPRPLRPAAAGLAEDDEGSSFHLLRHRASAWPSLRGAPAVREAAGGGAPPLPSETQRQAKALRYGRELRVVFLARAAERSGGAVRAADSPDGLSAWPRRLLLSFFVSDDTISLVEMHDGAAGSQFSKRRGAGALTPWHPMAERTTLLKRCRAPHGTPVPGGGGSTLALADVFCGARLCIAGTQLRVTCCEPSSRRLLSTGGLAAELGLGDGEWPGADEEEWTL